MDAHICLRRLTSGRSKLFKGKWMKPVEKIGIRKFFIFLIKIQAEKESFGLYKLCIYVCGGSFVGEIVTPHPH